VYASEAGESSPASAVSAFIPVRPLMLNYVIKRFLSMVPVAHRISILLFFMMRLLPGDRPRSGRADGLARGNRDIRTQLGLDRPIYGRSFLPQPPRAPGPRRSARTQNPVIEEIWAGCRTPCCWAVVAISLACPVRHPGGIISAMRPYTWVTTSSP